MMAFRIERALLVHDAASNDTYEHLLSVGHCSSSTPQRLSPSNQVYIPDLTLPLINSEILDQIVSLFLSTNLEKHYLPFLSAGIVWIKWTNK